MKIKRICKKEYCNSILSKNCNGEFCNRHRDRTGVNNPFFGKTHSDEVKNDLKAKCSKSSKKKWENLEYREKVIKAVSKPRRESFKLEQSERIKLWFEENPEQREIRSIHMSNSWKEGKINSNNFSCNRSKIENELYRDIDNLVNGVSRDSIKFDGSWILPDVLIEDSKYVIELFGNFWHANPRNYEANDIIHHELTAKEIWDRDKLRISKLEDLGYTVLVIWEDEYKQNRKQILDKLDQLFN